MPQRKTAQAGATKPGAKAAPAASTKAAPAATSPRNRPSAPAAAAAKQTPAKAAPAPAAAEKEKKGAAPAPAASKTVRKSPLVEKVKSFIDEAEKGLSGKVNEIQERQVQGDEGKVDVVFCNFSANGEKDKEVDDTYNIEQIKKVLFHYHTAPEKVATGKVLIVEILTPQGDGAAHTLAIHEE